MDTRCFEHLAFIKLHLMRVYKRTDRSRPVRILMVHNWGCGRGRVGSVATERYFSCWLAAAIYVKIAEELEVLIDMADRHEGKDVDHKC